jgi:pyridoxal phosphate enzyme (YggS family)
VTSQAQESERREQLRRQLEAVRARIAAACSAAGRPADEVTLIAITKTFPASDVAHLAALGQTDFGENRDQEAEPKAAQCAALHLNLRWHFVGQLQVNKSASVVRYADVVHSVDRSRLARALGAHAVTAGRQLTCLIQVNLDEAAGETTARGGAFPDEVLALAGQIAAQDGLELGGVMAIAPLGAPARPAFARLRQVAEQVRAAHPGATMISAGMSGDMDDAIAEGATHVRVGTALLGGRPLFVR